MYNFIDTHTHLYLAQFDADRPQVLARAQAEGVSRMYLPNINSRSIEAMLQLEASAPEQCYAMMGLHPCSVDSDFELELRRVEQELARRSWVAIGEIGTDLYWDKTYWVQQQEAFRIQVQWAIQYDLPVVIHCRNSFAETIELLQARPHPRLRGIFHCFTGTLAEAQQAIEMGFLLGIGGVATYKNGGLDAVLPHINLAHLVLETDSPYLAPIPHRGKRNESAHIALIAKRLAEILHEDLSTIAAITTANALALFHPETKK